MDKYVSIVMCTYNGSKYLAEQLESIVNQDYRPIEMVVVDDCSTDNTWQILQGWQSKYPFFRIFQNESNLGYNKNFEKAIQLATGEYIALSDQDDIWMPDKISLLVAAMQAKPDAVLAHSKNVAMENGILKYNHANLRNFFEGTDLRKLFLHSQFSGHAILFKTSLVPSLVPFPEGIIYDWWISVNACAAGSIVFVDKILVHHRVHDSNATKQLSKTNLTSSLDIDQILALFLTINDMQPTHKLFLEQLIAVFKAHELKSVGTIDWDFFFFFLKNRKIIYAHKKRKLPIISQVKHACRLAKKNFRGAGGEI
ncbi:glycosyltransferase family 2 protein [Parasediminibacterium sp. JCM 36343]|uniref:glycosyltransferase family 2 protein n=1 Tax=Parasediminibacterium sp. JCM 36343 TaxID=3374279 RepID=UPI00397DA9F4